MAAVTVQPSVMPPVRTKVWKFRLLDTSDRHRLCQSFFCPCCVFGESCQELGHSSALCCLAYACTLLHPYLWWVNSLLGCLYRHRVRRRYYIRQGNLLTDCCTYLFCCPCVLTQGSRQTDYELHRRRRARGLDCGCLYEQGAMLRVGQREFHWFGSGRPRFGCRFFPPESHRLLDQGSSSSSCFNAMPPPPDQEPIVLPYVYAQNAARPFLSMIVPVDVNAVDPGSDASQLGSVDVRTGDNDNVNRTGSLSLEVAEEITSSASEGRLAQMQFQRMTVREFFNRRPEESARSSLSQQEDDDRDVLQPATPEIYTVYTIMETPDQGAEVAESEANPKVDK